MIHHQRRALITGGCGFVGRHLTRRLLQDGYRLLIIDDCSTGRHCDNWLPDADQRVQVTPDLIEYQGGNVYLLHCDAKDFFSGKVRPPVIADEKFGDVFHFAAIVGGRLVIDGNPMAVAQDLALDSLFFNWVIQSDVQRVLYASSSAAYPIDLQGPDGAIALKESDIVFGGRLGQPDMTYGWAKLTGEYLARIAHTHYGIHTACVRPFSGYGEEQDLTYPVPSIALRAAKREDPLTVWGSGLQGRDFVHIDDCIEAMLRTLSAVNDGSAINIGSGILTNFLEVAALFAKLEGYSPEIRPLDGKPVGVHSRYADISRMSNLLNWKPGISLEEGFGRVLAVAHTRASQGH